MFNLFCSNLGEVRKDMFIKFVDDRFMRYGLYDKWWIWIMEGFVGLEYFIKIMRWNEIEIDVKVCI